MLLFHRSLEIGYKSHFETRTERYWVQDGVDFTVFYLSDFHFNGFSRRLLAEMIRAVEKINPTIILLGGDYADTRQGLAFFEQLLQWLSQRPNVFAIAGNHDYFLGITKIKNLCDQYGIGWIEKGSVCVDIDGFKVQIVGKIPQKALPDAHFNILCLHEPVDISALTTPFDLVFAGHLHGCQVVFWETEKGLFPGKFFYRWNILKTQIGSCLYLVSKGLGDTLPIRWNCKRDIVLVEVINK